MLRVSLWILLSAVAIPAFAGATPNFSEIVKLDSVYLEDRIWCMDLDKVIKKFTSEIKQYCVPYRETKKCAGVKAYTWYDKLNGNKPYIYDCESDRIRHQSSCEEIKNSLEHSLSMKKSEVCLMSASTAKRYCARMGGRLPTANEYADYAILRGAEGYTLRQEGDILSAGSFGRIIRDGHKTKYDLVRAQNMGVSESFFYSSKGYETDPSQKFFSGFGKLSWREVNLPVIEFARFWTSSLDDGDLDKSQFFSFDSDTGDFWSTLPETYLAVRCELGSGKTVTEEVGESVEEKFDKEADSVINCESRAKAIETLYRTAQDFHDIAMRSGLGYGIRLNKNTFSSAISVLKEDLQNWERTYATMNNCSGDTLQKVRFTIQDKIGSLEFLSSTH